MKYSKSLCIVALAVSLSLLLSVAMSATPALAQSQSITLSAVSGFRGTTVTVTGTDFHNYKNSDVHLYFGNNWIKTIQVSDNGTFTTDFNVPAYATPGTSYSVNVQDKNNTILVEEWFIVGAKIDLDYDEGEIGKSIEIGGRYFDAKEEVHLYFSSDKANIGDSIDSAVTAYEYIGEASTNSYGDFDSLCHFSIPSKLNDGAVTENVHIGDYYIYATYHPDGKRIRAAAKFIVISGTTELEPITLSPTSGFLGTTVTVTGTDFQSYSNTDVHLYFDSNWIKSIRVSDNGTFTTDFNVPNYVTPGTSYSVTIQNEENVILAEELFSVGARIDLDYDKGEVGKWIKVTGRYFDTGKGVRLYFSGDEADIGDSIDSEVTAYEYIGEVYTNSNGYFDSPYHFFIPGELTDGTDKEDVRSGDYYIYAIYYPGGNQIKAIAKFVLIGIGLEPDEGPVGSEVEIAGEDLRSNQEISVKYDGDNIEIVSGDGKTDEDGRFTCAIIIPESAAGNHIILAADESGHKYEAVFSVKPRLTITSTSAAAGDEVKLSGTGFEVPYYESDRVTITLGGEEVLTIPTVIRADSNGSFSGSFIVPLNSSGSVDVTSQVVATDNSLNTAEAQLTILATPDTSGTLDDSTGISLHPATSQASPGHVGMEVTADGTGFMAHATVTITYSSGETGEAIIVATATTDDNGDFSATFSVPPSLAGHHTVTCTDGTNSATSIVTMESEAPSIPVPLLPQGATALETEAYFDWDDVEDISGVTYTFQVASDANFTTIVLEEKGLTSSEYTITKTAKLQSTKEEEPYYWRLKAVDGAFNDSGWTRPELLYVDSSQTSSSGWNFNVWTTAIPIGLGAIALVLVILRLPALRKRR